MAIQRTTLSEQILSAVIKILQEGHYKKGDLIPTEKELAEELNVSRNSVREAMKSLNITGFTQSIPGKGTILQVEVGAISGDIHELVRSILGASLTDILYVRKALESEAAELAAQRVETDAQNREAMVRAMDKLKESLQAEEFDVYEEGRDFHMAIAAMSGNALLYSLLKTIRDEFTHSVSMMQLGTTEHGTEEDLHQAVCDAILRGDPAEAKAAMERHCDHTICVYQTQWQDQR